VFDVPSYRVGRLFGIPLEINLSWIIIFVLVSLSLGAGYYPSLVEASNAPRLLLAIVGIVSAFLFFASIVVHELSHALVTRTYGGHVEKITLFIFGGVAELTDEPVSPGREFLMAIAGPAMSLFIAVVCFLGYAISAARGLPWYFWAPLQYLAMINFFVGVFNLLPGFPLDGGRVLRSILWGLTGNILKATRWATLSGQAIGWCLVGYAILAVLHVVPGSTDALWLGLIGWFIVWLAGASYRQQVVRSRLSNLTVGSIMAPSPRTVPGDETVEDLLHEHFLGGQHSRYPVLFEGAVHGLVSLDDVRAVARPDWPYVRIIDVANTDLAEVTVAADAHVDVLLTRLSAEKPGAMIVVDGGRMVGIVTRSDLIAAIQRG
jgi:Zn-dependent protease/predicted transcriptional regulator